MRAALTAELQSQLKVSEREPSFGDDTAAHALRRPRCREPPARDRTSYTIQYCTGTGTVPVPVRRHRGVQYRYCTVQELLPVSVKSPHRYRFLSVQLYLSILEAACSKVPMSLSHPLRNDFLTPDATSKALSDKGGVVALQVPPPYIVLGVSVSRPQPPREDGQRDSSRVPISPIINQIFIMDFYL